MMYEIQPEHILLLGSPLFDSQLYHLFGDMVMKPPPIKVEIIHIDGPLKGTIQEFYDSPISIGRHPDCQVTFPKDMTTISRQHAEIHRDGNRYKIIDHSTNRTMVNGKAIQEAYLKDGDIMTISDGGPKISFISTVLEADAPLPLASENISTQSDSNIVRPEPVAEETPLPEPPVISHYPEQDPISQTTPEMAHTERAVIAEEQQNLFATGEEAASNPVIETSHNPLIIQYGVVLKTFDTLPITIGTSTDCGFILEEPSVLVQHVQIFFADQNYHVKDLTGRGLVTVNGLPVNNGTVLSPGTHLALSASGPYFQFLGEGRLVEADSSLPPSSGNSAEQGSDEDDAKGKKGKAFWPFK